MKQFLLLFILAVSFIGCSGNGDNEPTGSSAFLIGTWMGTSFIKNGITYDTSSCIDLNAMALYRTFIFNENGSMYYKDTCKAEGREGVYEFKKSVLTFKVGAGTSTADVIIISENKIRINITAPNSYSFILEKSF